MLRRDLLKSSLATGLATVLSGSAAASVTSAPEFSSDRSFWLDRMQRVAHPVLSALSQRRLRAAMPVEMRPGSVRPYGAEDHHLTACLEAFGRTLAGIAPWLEMGAATGV